MTCETVLSVNAQDKARAQERQSNYTEGAGANAAKRRKHTSDTSENQLKRAPDLGLAPDTNEGVSFNKTMQPAKSQKSVTFTLGRDQQKAATHESIDNGESLAPSQQMIETVKAFVSNTQTLQADMLVRTARIGSRLCEAHLDTCASHCFVNEATSLKWAEWGHPAYNSPVRYAVSQGNPLCIASRVHILPLAMMQANGMEVRWTAVLFIVANCGADIIIGYPTLRLGGIVEYEPPSNYETLLAQGAQDDPAGEMLLAEATRILHMGIRHQYGPPESKFNWESVPSSVLATFTKPKLGMKIAKTSKPDTSKKTKTGIPLVAALTEAEPYGKNPPLPEVVMDALTLLKNLAEDKQFSYTTTQLEEVKEKLKSKRPTWANCLTLQHLEEVTDRETEAFLNAMMDRPRYQKSIFQTAMHLNTVSDFTDFEINQMPGRDNWNPAQPTKYKNPYTTKIVDDWLDTLILNEKVRESSATHPARVTVVERPPRDPRVCLDYRNRNHRSEIPIYPMPDVHDFLDDAVGYTHYCSFDMAKMFTQFRIKEAHKHLAAFITHRGVYEPNVVMFGLAGAPQHAVREVGGAMAKDPRTNGIKFTEWAYDQNLKGVTPPYDICPLTKIVKGSRLRPFIDDVFLKSMHQEGMIKMVELFFEFCLEHNLILSRKKALIMKRRLKTLGFVVSREGKHLDPSRIISLLEAAIPQSKETLHSLLSSYTFVRMFIPNFASIAAPLHEATKGIIWKGPGSGRSNGTRQVDPAFVWTDEMTRAYEQLRSALLEAPLLATPDWSLPLFLSVDASMRGEGWVLWQMITTSDGAKVAVAILYGSRKYTDTERKWETTRQEATAIRSALQDVESYIFGQHFFLFSDHLNLRFMHNSVNRAVLRMRDYLAQFNMTVVHCPGVWNNADAVSRLESDALPMDRADNLNSATVGRIQESGVSISQGTDTSQDQSSTEDVVILVKQYPKDDINSHAQVLRTSVCDQGLCANSNCWLCTLQSDNQTLETPEESEHEAPTHRASVLQTESSAREHQPSQNTQEDMQPILDQIMSSIGSDLLLENALVIAEARTWNELTLRKLAEETTPITYDLQDWEDAEWCGEINRESVVVKAVCNRMPVRVLPKEHIFNPIMTTQNKQKLQQNAIEVSEVTRTTSPSSTKEGEETRTPYRPVPGIKSTEIVDCGTQTTPADFRMATVQLPYKEDFIAIHNDLSGHHGLEFSYRKLLKRCGSKWANERGQATKIKEALKTFLDGCPICQKLRGLREKIKCKHSFIISRPFLETSYDFIIFTRPDKHGNRYLLVAIDNFSKLVELKAVKHRDAETVAQFLLEVASRYGHCARLRSDREASFMGLIISKLNENRGTETTPCIPYRPEANSICERQNAIVMFHLTALILGCNLGPQTKVGWSELIPKVFSIVNNTPKNPLGISPLSIVYGVFANYDRPLLPPSTNQPGTTSNPVDYVDVLMEWQMKLLDISEEVQSQHFAKLNKRFNPKPLHRQFNQGDFVIQQKDSTGISGKPNARWIGPYLVMERRDNDPTHPVLDLMNLTDMTLKEAATDDCRLFNTSWFENDTILPELAKIAAQDLDEFVVQEIIGHKPSGETRTIPLSKYYFLVKWEGFSDPTWEPYSGIKNIEPLDKYGIDHPGLNIPMSDS